MKERSNKEKETAEGHVRHDNNVVLSNFLPVETLLLCYCRCVLGIFAICKKLPAERIAVKALESRKGFCISLYKLWRSPGSKALT
jgi:hypothetical protein